MKRNTVLACLVASAAVVAANDVAAQVRVQYGRITNVQTTTVNDSTSRTVGTLVGGGIGLATGSGQSGSNRALRGLGGAAAGRAVGNMAGSSQAFEYTVLVDGTQTVRIVSDQAGKRIGDCVAVEQGQFANIRLVATAAARHLRRPLPPRRRRRRHPPHPQKRSKRARANRPRRRCWQPARTRSSTRPSAACGCCAANEGAWGLSCDCMRAAVPGATEAR